jgi:2,3-bisphosphoglycerate-independent phosphoglycerate mutase
MMSFNRQYNRAGSLSSSSVFSCRNVVLIFVDGLGVGNSKSNPTLTYDGTLFNLQETSARWKPIDATLSVPGIPQSATGQTSLLTGVNSQAKLGRHATGFPGPTLREIMREHSILKQLTDNGKSARFINAFRPLFWEISEERRWTLSATTIANLSADLPFFTLEDLKSEQSVYQDFTNQDLIEKGFDVPLWTPEHAGNLLAKNCQKYDFTLYEYFKTDHAGHSQDRELCEEVLFNLDRFINSFITAIPSDTLVLLTSDHGNIEDCSINTHTTNKVPLFSWGDDSEMALSQINSLIDVVPLILSAV